MQWIIDFFNLILSGFQYVLDFITEGVFELLRQFGEFLYSFVEMVFYDQLHYGCQLSIFLLNTLFGDIDFSGPILSAWNSLPLDIREFLVFFRLPQIVSILISAFTLRLVRTNIPFLR